MKPEPPRVPALNSRPSARRVDDASLHFVKGRHYGLQNRREHVARNEEEEEVNHAKLDREDAEKVLSTYALLRSKSGSQDYRRVTAMLEDVFS